MHVAHFYLVNFIRKPKGSKSALQSTKDDAVLGSAGRNKEKSRAKINTLLNQNIDDDEGFSIEHDAREMSPRVDKNRVE